ncbi:hypothetical protein FHX82_005128 [Amycolatopsis bartoniae]|uniref:Uncharacterized protein n=1 Tax=Amycolatopsis bartoniae TaxID=941986 RepID=A0A8H9M2N7_9PSEU|nr:hypothetical protein [Amycolatopsis bartoniae]MBB2938052.1 hypothetical protein [Amycolatopsis bartoniae]TVT09937.1 hypothetical protein FNH07_06710 [Amycolatopsis bartoniae]GHF32360.1 hypothetical protein GCM10017566_01100 [Amycolatopsis bartoniae]
MHLPRLTQRNVALARAAWGLTLAGCARSDSGSAATRKVAALLAARHLAQSALVLRLPRSSLARRAWLADVAHGGSAVVAALVSERWRRLAVTDAVIAFAWAGASGGAV